MTNPIGLYLHIPFCQKKCNYCDFLTYTDEDEKIDLYVQYLLNEIRLYKNQNIFLDTVYIGGGTPSYLAASYMDKILKELKNTFKITENAEITIEMNPESVTEEKIKIYLKNGVNRFSMGVQTFNNDVLQIMGRIHNSYTVFKKLKMLRELGCKNISIDLMLANPKQDMKVLEKDLEIVSKLDIDHVSYYSLILKEKTYFDIWYNDGKIELFDPEIERNMYHKVVNTLKLNGFNQYEISSFAKSSKFESTHNKKYWNLQDYIGIGMGAASNIGLTRYTNHRKFDVYFKMIDNGDKPIQEVENLDKDTREKEYMMLKLRMQKGFEISDMNTRFNIDIMEKYGDVLKKNIENGILENDGINIKFTDFGIDNGNMFFRDLYKI